MTASDIRATILQRLKETHDTGTALCELMFLISTQIEAMDQKKSIEEVTKE